MENKGEKNKQTEGSYNKTTNRKYKDTVFRMLFNNKKEALGLYNNLFDTEYTDESLIDIVTLEDVLFIPRKNDVAFTMNGRFVVLVEHQSTINENMPLRFLIYIARLYEKIIDADNIYRRKLIKIPAPEFVVLYNGRDDLKRDGEVVTELELNLSDAFKDDGNVQPKLFKDDKGAQLELKVKVIDIRYSSRNKLVTKKDTLEQYSRFIQIIEDCRKSEENLDEVMKTAVNMAIELGKRGYVFSLADLDVVDPYFRSRDCKQILKQAGGRLIASSQAHMDADLPSMPPDVSVLFDNPAMYGVLDIGGDPSGARVLHGIGSS